MNQSTRAGVAPSSSPLIALNMREFGTIIGLVLICGVFSMLSQNFLTVDNLVNILQQSSINACTAVGMTLVIISGGIDLSVGSVAAFSAVVSGSAMAAGMHPVLAVGIGLILGAACGASNGLMITLGSLQPFIVTLGTLSLFRAAALIFTGGQPVFGLSPAFRATVASRVGGLPTPVIIVGFSSLVAWIVLRKTPLGEYLLAVGGNEEAARLCGIPVNRVKRSVYLISGFCAGIAGLIVIAINSSSDANLVGLGMELDAIAAVAVGGTRLTGGYATVIGTLVGALIIQLVRYTLLANGVPDSVAYVVKGGIIVASVWIQQKANRA